MLQGAKLSPNRAYFGRIPRSQTQPITRKIVVTRGDGGPISPRLDTIKTKNLQAELREIEEGERYEIDFTLSPPFADRIRENVTLHTGVAEAPTQTIYVYAMVAPRVRTSPSRVIVPDPPVDHWSQQVRLIWDDRTSPKILGASIDAPGLAVHVMETGRYQRVVVRRVEGFTPWNGSRTLLLQTEDPIAPTIEIPVSVRRLPRRPAARRGAPVRRGSLPVRTPADRD